jgi:hypothetical protein
VWWEERWEERWEVWWEERWEERWEVWWEERWEVWWRTTAARVLKFISAILRSRKNVTA